MPVPVNSEPLPRQSARMLAFEQLRSWIEQGILAPGEVISDVKIAEALGVSRTPVREALQMLEHHGAVETTPGRSTRVREVSRSDVRLVYRPLAVLQALAAEVGTQHATPEDVQAMEAANERLMAAAAHRRPAAARKADDEFHDVLVNRAANPYLESAIESLRIHMRRLETLYFKQLGPVEDSYRQHKEIVAAVKSGDSDRARDLTHRNFLPEHWLRDVGPRG